MRAILFLLLLGLAGLVIAFVYLPWWGSVLLLLALLLVGKLCLGRLLEALFKLPFRAKGAVLKQAHVAVESVRPTSRPARADGDAAEGSAEADKDRQYYVMELTLTPGQSDDSFQLWEPGELRLVGLDAEAEKPEGGAEEVCAIVQCEVDQEGQFVADEGSKFAGPQRLRLTFGVRPGPAELQFRYYFELYGRVLLPTPAGPN